MDFLQEPLKRYEEATTYLIRLSYRGYQTYGIRESDQQDVLMKVVDKQGDVVLLVQIDDADKIKDNVWRLDRFIVEQLTVKRDGGVGSIRFFEV